MNKKEVLELIKEADDRYDLTLDGYDVEEIATECYPPEEAHMIYKISQGNDSMFVLLEGYYDSWGDGLTLEGDVYEVSPREKTITVYEAV